MVDVGYRHCFESATAAAGRTLSDDELDNLFARTQGRMNRYVREGLAPRDAAIRAGRELAEEHRAAAVRARLGAAQNLEKRVAMRTWLTERAEGEFKRGDGQADLFKAVRASLEGLPHAPGASLSTSAIGKARLKEYIGALDTELGKAGLKGVARSGQLDKQIGQELYELSHRGDTGSFPGVSGNKQAQDIAGIFNKYLSLARQRLNDQGAWIGHLDDYVMRTSHDPIRMFKATFEKWRDATLPLLDQSRTFENAEPGKENEFLQHVWSSLTTGVHFSDKGGIGFKAPAFSGPGNMAARLSESRVLHFKDADSWTAYMHDFGTPGTLIERLGGTLKRAAEQEALLRKWGTNPQVEFDNTLRWLKEKYTDNGGEAAVIRLTDHEHTLRNLFDMLTGEARRPANAMGAQLGNGLRSIAIMSKLGNVLFAHLSSVVTTGRELQRGGVNWLESYGNALKSFLGPYQGADARLAHDLLHASVEGAHAALAAPGWIDDSLPGTMSKITNGFMRLTGLPATVDWKKTMAAYGVSRLLGRQIGKSFDELLPETRDRFTSYGITPAEWDALRAVPDHVKNSLGHELITPDAATRAGLSPQAADTLALKLATFYSDVGDRATITPGIGDRQVMLRGTRPGTWEGELMRFIAQFKTWPVAMVRQTLAEERGTPAIGGAVGGMMQIAAGMMLFGYLRNTLADAFQGKEPRPASDPRTWLHAFASGGSAGIFGDYLFGQANRFGQGIGESVLGPVLGEGLNDVMTLWNNMRDYAAGDGTKMKDIPPELLRMTKNNTPFVNLFYTRAALNYLFLSSLQETMSPGYLRRSRDALKKQTGQGYIAPSTPGFGWMNPESHLHTFGR